MERINMALLVKEGLYHVQLKSRQPSGYVVFPNVYIQDHVQFSHGLLSFFYRDIRIQVPVQEILALHDGDLAEV
jgi:hypothetical protein